MNKRTKHQTHRSPIRVPRRSEMAAPPGTIAVPEGNAGVNANLISFDAEVLKEVRVCDARELQARGQSNKVLWLNVVGLDDRAFLRSLGATLGLHPLVLEDVVSGHQRPKIEDYGDYLYLVLRVPKQSSRFEVEQLNILLGENYVVTLETSAERNLLEPVRERIRNCRGKIRASGAGYLAYAIMDAVVDHYFPIIDATNAQLEAIEEELGGEPRNAVAAELHAIRADLHAQWRTVAATQEALAKLVSGKNYLFPDDVSVHLRDCVDHCAQLLDAIHACRDLSGSLFEMYQAVINNRANESMRVLTVIATIFMPLSFIAGVYGMNFDRDSSPLNMPELGFRYGYPVVVFVMLTIAVVLLVSFWRRGWLGGSEEK